MLDHGLSGGPAASMDPTRVLVVEDHSMLAEALALGLSARGFECTVADVPACADILAKADILDKAARLRPSLVLLDLDLGGEDGLDLVPDLRAIGANVLVVTGCNDEPRLAAALALGARGWVSKTEPFEALLEAAAVVATGRTLLPTTRHAALTRVGRARIEADREVRSQVARLTSKEREVLDALSDGRGAREIADDMVVSVSTVRSHIRAVLLKLGVSTQLAAVARSRRAAVGHLSASARPPGPRGLAR